MSQRRRPPRRGLVLGSGGVLGFAWMVGAIRALEDEVGFDAREVDICVGTSAGAIMAAFVACGVDSRALLRHQQGSPHPADPSIGWDYDHDGGSGRPFLPKFRFGSPQLMYEAARHPGQVPPIAAISAFVPPGRGDLNQVNQMITALDRQRTWPSNPITWIVAMDYDTGRRIPFGRDGAPLVSLADAVTASCAIPGWYSPVAIDGHRYVDGGTHSATSVDLLIDRDLDELYVLAPMASFAYDRPRSMLARAERQYRRTVTRRLLRECAKLRAGGSRLILLGPGPDDLEAIGANMMDPNRRSRVLATSLRTTADAVRQSLNDIRGDSDRAMD